MNKPDKAEREGELFATFKLPLEQIVLLSPGERFRHLNWPVVIIKILIVVGAVTLEVVYLVSNVLRS